MNKIFLHYFRQDGGIPLQHKAPRSQRQLLQPRRRQQLLFHLLQLYLQEVTQKLILNTVDR